MKLRPVLIVALALAVTLACNMPTGAPATAASTAEQPAGGKTETSAPPTGTPESAPPTETFTPLPSLTPTITLTPTPSVPTVTASDKPVNCRFGPGTAWEPVDGLDVGESEEILGKNDSGSWWQIQIGSKLCWVAASVTTAGGNLGSVPVVSIPQALVTAVGLDIDPSTVTVPGCVFPGPSVELNGTITTNGPVTVTWHWETSEGNVSSSVTLDFDAFGSQKVSDVYKGGGEGTHWVKLVVTSPNSKLVKTDYKVVCGP